MKMGLAAVVAAIACSVAACTTYAPTFEYRNGGDNAPFLTSRAATAFDFSMIETGESAVVGYGANMLIGRPNVVSIEVMSPVRGSANEQRILDTDGDGIDDFKDGKSQGPIFEAIKLVRNADNAWVSSEIITSNGRTNSVMRSYRIYALNVGNAGFSGPIRVVDRISPLVKFTGAPVVKQVGDLRGTRAFLSAIPFVGFVSLAMSDFPIEGDVYATHTFENGLLTVNIPPTTLRNGKGVMVEFQLEIPLNDSTAELFIQAAGK
jgi:hypothetical protein